MNDSTIFADEIFGFHVQQTVEKTLKAWIAHLNMRYPLTHDISTLLAILEEQGCEVESFWDLVDYNPFAVQFRYAAFDEEEPLDRTTILLHIERLFEHVRVLIC